MVAVQVAQRAWRRVHHPAYIALFAAVSLVQATLVPATNTLIATHVPRDRRGAGFGLVSSVQALAMMAGPMVAAAAGGIALISSLGNLGSAASPAPAMHHLRVESGRHEIDLLVEVGRGKVFAIEFKAGAAPSPADARHLTWLSDEIGDRFAGGVVLHAGQSVVELGDRIAAIPLSAMWTSP